jgi:hypothetical protein
MLRCTNLLPCYPELATASATGSVDTHHRRIAAQWLLLAGLLSLSLSAAMAQGQSDTTQSNASVAGVHPEQCDGQIPGDAHKLSTKSVEPSGTTEGQEAAQTGSTLTQMPLRISGVDSSAPAPDQDGARCARPHSETAKQPPPKDTAASADVPVLPQADATEPNVSYSDGVLKVTGHGERLAQILENIKSLTGIQMDIPASLEENQIFDDVGPAPVRDALIKLLDGARLNYLILGSPQDPQRVSQLVLTAETTTAQVKTPVAGVTVAQASGPTLYGAGFGDSTGQEAAAEEPPPPPAANAIPVNVNIQQAAAAEGKTPGEILDELQKKQIQQLDEQSAQTAPH